MRRWIGTLLTALLAAMPLLALDKPAEEKGNNRTTQFQELQKDFQKSVEEVSKELRKARTQEELRSIVTKLSKEYTPRIVKLAEGNPKDKVSGDILFWAVDNVPLEGGKVYDLLADNWAGDARIKGLCLRMTQMPDEAAEKLLHKVSEENKDKDARGLAVFALANLNKEKSEGQGDVKIAEQAEKLFERVGKEFAEVKLPRGTAGAQAKSSLEEIRKRGIGKKMPNLESENLQGKKVQLTDHRGKVVVLDIWATWCGPCKAMIPHERDMVEKLKDKPFTLISISADEKKETLEKFLELNKMPWTHWWNGASGGILKELDIQFFPTIYVLDGEGVIRYKNIRNKQLEEAVEKLLAETKDKK
jgi:thiol-disulfide isomerase/thioredoxin